MPAIQQRYRITLTCWIQSSTAGTTLGMTEFKNEYAPHKVLLIGNNGMPWQEFLK
jgi:hypothetical protein